MFIKNKCSSDGALGQQLYKVCVHYFHEQIWYRDRMAFLTSHGKSDCDNGNNGITKGLVVMARLENNADGHIATAKEMH